MELNRGRVVRSTAGRDKGGFLTVLELCPPYALLCDGKRRPLERPKRKKLIHLAPTGTVLGEEELSGNRSIRRALRPFNEGVGVKPEKEVMNDVQAGRD